MQPVAQSAQTFEGSKMFDFRRETVSLFGTPLPKAQKFMVVCVGVAVYGCMRRRSLPLGYTSACNHKLQSCINTARPYLMYYVGRVASAPPSIMIKLRYCDKKRRSDIVTEQERSLAISTRHRPSHAIRMVKSLRTAVFQARRYYSASGWDEFKCAAVRIWLRCKQLVLRSYANYKLLYCCGLRVLRLYETSSMAKQGRNEVRWRPGQ